VAICSVGEIFGGVERHILSLLDGLRSTEVPVLLVLFHDGELAHQARIRGFEPVVLLGGKLSFLAACRRLAFLIKEAGIQVVHAHGYKATVYCAVARCWHAFALVKTQHGLPEPMSSGRLTLLRDRIYHLLDAAATRMAVKTVCYVTEELRARGMPAHAGMRSTVIPNGVPDLERRQFERPAELRTEWFNIAIVGRLDAVKGQEVAIRALVAAELPASVHLQIIGTGPSEPELRAVVTRLGLGQRVHFLGFRRNIYEYVAHCDLLLIPSLHEGLPFILLEAMALSTPIVASRVGGLAEVLDDRKTGLLIPPSDPTSLANAVAALHRHPELRQELGNNAQRIQRTLYSIREMTARYKAVYRTNGAILDDK
jgi:glycosyltransferase involved in cell wall biosynthesis